MNKQSALELFAKMMQENPQFAQFVRDNEGKSAEQIAKDYNVSPALLQLLIK